MNENTILGISPGTRFIGIAILADGKLVNWQVRSFPGEWSDEKLRVILAAIDTVIVRYRIEQVTVPVLSERIHQGQNVPLVDGPVFLQKGEILPVQCGEYLLSAVGDSGTF